MEPIGNLISGERLKVASLQDYIVELIYSKLEPSALLYGGTAILSSISPSDRHEN
ncbi:MAG: hypothetical protein M1161_03350 [Candidatus Thermoplasmatota archaeon]|jgi:hypothetical protein|nr:hypothetical protein [Candidatus Thermoplasmatota archaeon]